MENSLLHLAMMSTEELVSAAYEEVTVRARESGISLIQELVSRIEFLTEENEELRLQLDALQNNS